MRGSNKSKYLEKAKKKFIAAQKKFYQFGSKEGKKNKGIKQCYLGLKIIDLFENESKMTKKKIKSCL